VQCHPWHGQPSTVNFGACATFRCRVVGEHASNRRRDATTLTVMRFIHPHSKFEVRRPFRSEDMADFFNHGVKRPGDLDL